MKTCLICSSSSDDAAPTCPTCGEASWAATATPKADEVVVTDEATAEKTGKKRSKK